MRDTEKLGRTWRNRTTGAAQDAALEEAVVLVGDRTGLASESDVSKGVMVKTPTHLTNTDRDSGAAVRNVET